MISVAPYDYYASTAIQSGRSVSGTAEFSVPKSPIRSETAATEPTRAPGRDASADSIELTKNYPELLAAQLYAPQQAREAMPALPSSISADSRRFGRDDGSIGEDDDIGDSPAATDPEGKNGNEEEAEGKIGQPTDAKGQPLDDAEVRQLDELKQRDQEVRQHEQTHKAVGGNYAGAISYEYQQGPDGKRYAVGGEVSIDVSPEKDPAATVAKMRQVRAAALAPAQPSAQDRSVAAEAMKKENEARQEMASEAMNKADGATATESGDNAGDRDNDESSATSASASASASGTERNAPANRPTTGAAAPSVATLASSPDAPGAISSFAAYHPFAPRQTQAAIGYASINILA